MNPLRDWLKNAANVCNKYKKALVPIAAIGAFSAYQHFSSAPHVPEIPFSTFWNDVDNGRVAKVTVSASDTVSSHVTGTYKKGHSSFATSYPFIMSSDVFKELSKHNVEFSSAPKGWNVGDLVWNGLLITWIAGPLLFRIGQAVGIGPGGKLVLHEENTGATFDDVAGIDEAKGELQEIVDFLKNPERYQKVGARIPKGALLSGPPGTGKTLLARAVAGEAKVPFFSISGSDFVEKYIGGGAGRVRDMFEKANEKAPCIIFIDEIDALAGSRANRGEDGGSEERNQTINQLLVGMDGISPNKGVIVIGATNLIEKLDAALLRPGRLDRKIVVSLPDAKGREKILEIHTREMPLGDDVRLPDIARSTPNFSGADLANLANEAALHAARASKTTVDTQDFEAAKDRIILGIARSMILTEDQRKLTAYHEAGHALTALYLDGCAETEKVTIIPHGEALGVTVTSQEDQYNITIGELKDRLVQAFGGREAENIVFGPEKITAGASNDIQQATRIAHRMVTEFGMSEKLGQVDLRLRDEIYMSEETLKEIDREIRRFIDNARMQANKILTTHRVELDEIARALLERDTLSGPEIREISKRASRRNNVIPLTPA